MAREFFLFIINGLTPYCVGPFDDAVDADGWAEEVLDPHTQRIFFEGALPSLVLPRNCAEAIMFGEGEEPCPDCKGLGAFPKFGIDCARCYGGGTISAAIEAARTLDDRYHSAAIAAGWYEQGDGTWAHDGEEDGEPGLVADAKAACELDNITVV